MTGDMGTRRNTAYVKNVLRCKILNVTTFWGKLKAFLYVGSKISSIAKMQEEITENTELRNVCRLLEMSGTGKCQKD
jgi:hypothetical protein